MLCFLLLTLSIVATADRPLRSCGTCDPSQCEPLPSEGCSSGLLLDACGCCAVCASGAGEPCGGRGDTAKRCASGLECVKSDKDKKSKHGVCVCKSNFPVCGSDGVSYKTGCDLKAASVKAVSDNKPEIKILNKGKCAQAPVIVTVPGEIWNVTGSQVFLNCEATGIPTPVLTWRMVSDGKGKNVPLPGDKDNLAVQTRGGPEKHEVTGWVLISPLTKDEAGSYECHASNIKGEASAVGTIHVVDSINDIPPKKDDCHILDVIKCKKGLQPQCLDAPTWVMWRPLSATTRSRSSLIGCDTKLLHIVQRIIDVMEYRPILLPLFTFVCLYAVAKDDEL